MPERIGRTGQSHAPPVTRGIQVPDTISVGKHPRHGGGTIAHGGRRTRRSTLGARRVLLGLRCRRLRVQTSCALGPRGPDERERQHRAPEESVPDCSPDRNIRDEKPNMDEGHADDAYRGNDGDLYDDAELLPPHNDARAFLRRGIHTSTIATAQLASW